MNAPSRSRFQATAGAYLVSILAFFAAFLHSGSNRSAAADAPLESRAAGSVIIRFRTSFDEGNRLAQRHGGKLYRELRVRRAE